MIYAPAYICAVLITVLRVGWMPLAVFLVHALFAHVLDLYVLWPPVDIPLHFLGGFAITYFVAGAVDVFSEHRLIRRPDALVIQVLVFSAACSAAVFWEFAEWTLDRVFWMSTQAGLDDTMLDLFMGVVGASCYTLIMFVRIMKPKLGAVPEVL